jgi:hypothetical protein
VTRIALVAASPDEAEASNTPITDSFEACDCNASTCVETVVFWHRLMMPIMALLSWFVVGVEPSSIAYVIMHCWQLPQLVMKDELATHETPRSNFAISVLHDAMGSATVSSDGQSPPEGLRNIDATHDTGEYNMNLGGEVQPAVGRGTQQPDEEDASFGYTQRNKRIQTPESKRAQKGSKTVRRRIVSERRTVLHAPCLKTTSVEWRREDRHLLDPERGKEAEVVRSRKKNDQSLGCIREWSTGVSSPPYTRETKPTTCIRFRHSVWIHALLFPDQILLCCLFVHDMYSNALWTG